MENATKALEMAASVLIGMLIIGIIVFAYTQFSDLKQTEENAKVVEQSSDFNQAYETYNREGVYGSELLSLANKVVDYNIRTQADGYTNIQLIIKFTSLPQNMSNNTYNSRYNFVLQMSGEELVASYEKLTSDITQKGNATLTSNDGTTKKVVQWEKLSNVTLRSYLSSTSLQKVQEYKDLCDAQTDLARKTFKQPKITYDKNNGRITKMEFEEK
ncbi:MAG: hypothetical protein ACI4VQ_01840 [Clostridia bacterium]